MEQRELVPKKSPKRPRETRYVAPILSQWGERTSSLGCHELLFACDCNAESVTSLSASQFMTGFTIPQIPYCVEIYVCPLEQENGLGVLLVSFFKHHDPMKPFVQGIVISDIHGPDLEMVSTLLNDQLKTFQMNNESLVPIHIVQPSSKVLHDHLCVCGLPKFRGPKRFTALTRRKRS